MRRSYEGMLPTTSSPFWAAIWEGLKVVGPTLIGLAALFTAFATRKRRSFVRAENKQLAAAATAHNAEASDYYARLGLDLMKELQGVQLVGEVLQGRLNYRTKMETIARNRTHRMTSAYQAAMYAVHEREELLRCITTKLNDEGIILGIDLDFIPFPMRTQEEIFGPEDLPLPPEPEIAH